MSNLKLTKKQKATMRYVVDRIVANAMKRALFSNESEEK